MEKVLSNHFCPNCERLEKRIAEPEAALVNQEAQMTTMAETIKAFTPALEEARRYGKCAKVFKRLCGNERFAAHLDHLFVFWKYPGPDATNWHAGQAIHPAVVNRKARGGNRILFQQKFSQCLKF